MSFITSQYGSYFGTVHNKTLVDAIRDIAICKGSFLPHKAGGTEIVRCYQDESLRIVHTVDFRKSFGWEGHLETIEKVSVEINAAEFDAIAKTDATAVIDFTDGPVSEFLSGYLPVFKYIIVERDQWGCRNDHFIRNDQWDLKYDSTYRLILHPRWVNKIATLSDKESARSLHCDANVGLDFEDWQDHTIIRDDSNGLFLKLLDKGPHPDVVDSTISAFIEERCSKLHGKVINQIESIPKMLFKFDDQPSMNALGAMLRMSGARVEPVANEFSTGTCSVVLDFGNYLECCEPECWANDIENTVEAISKFACISTEDAEALVERALIGRVPCTVLENVSYEIADGFTNDFIDESDMCSILRVEDSHGKKLGHGHTVGESNQPRPLSVVIDDYGANKSSVIKVILSITSLGLKEAMDLVNRAPCAALRDLGLIEACSCLAKLVKAGAAAHIEED